MAVDYNRGQNRHGDPVLTITITGPDDIYRLNWALLHAQVEFSEAARHTIHFLRKHMGKASFDRLDNALTGGKAAAYATDPRAQEVI